MHLYTNNVCRIDAECVYTRNVCRIDIACIHIYTNNVCFGNGKMVPFPAATKYPCLNIDQEPVASDESKCVLFMQQTWHYSMCGI